MRRRRKDEKKRRSSPSRADGEVELTAKEPRPLTEEGTPKKIRRGITILGRDLSRQLVVGLAVAVILAVAGVGIVVVKVTSEGGTEEPPKLPRPPLAIQEKDRRTPKAKGPVQEKVWVHGGAPTFADPYDQTGAGKKIPVGREVLVACKLYWPHPPSVSKEGFWYRIRTKPWNARFAAANVFWNGDKRGTTPSHATDFHVRPCKGSQLPAE